MGDRTDVTFTVRPPLPEPVQAWVDGDRAGEADPPEGSWPTTDGERLDLRFSECNYGENLDAASFLEAHRVSYDQRWGAGEEYGPGTRWVRFARDGTKRQVEAYDDEKPDLPRLLGLLKEGLVQQAIAHLERWMKEHCEPCKLGEEPETWEEGEGETS